jgi:hypothetical protein
MCATIYHHVFYKGVDKNVATESEVEKASYSKSQVGLHQEPI